MSRSILGGADGVVSKRSRSTLIDIREALLILLEFTNHPVCAAKERELLLMAQPPLLEKEGNLLASTNALASTAAHSCPLPVFQPVPEILAQLFNLRLCNISDVRLIGVSRGVILMVVLGGIELAQGLESRRNPVLEYMCVVQLPDIRFGNALLFVVGIEYRRTILPAHVVTLPVDLRGIVGNRKVDFQQLAECRLAGVVADFDDFRVIRATAADGAIVRGLGRASGVAAV